MQVDDTLGNGNAEFLKAESEQSKFFRTKLQKMLEKGDDAVFNGRRIVFRENGKYEINNSDKFESLEIVKTPEEFISPQTTI